MKRWFVLLLIFSMIMSLTACSFSIGDPVNLDEPGNENEDPGDYDNPDNNDEPVDDPTSSDGTFGSVLAGWSHFNFKPGQYFYYEVTSDSSGDGWVSVSVAEGSQNGTLDITCEGNWGLGEFSDTATLTPEMNGWDLSMKLSGEGTNAMMSLLDATILPFEQFYWEEGVEVTYGEKTFTCTESRDYAGISGLVMVCKTKHAFTDEELQYTYCVNMDVPIPLYVECPAANDIWRYELVEVDGF